MRLRSRFLPVLALVAWVGCTTVPLPPRPAGPPATVVEQQTASYQTAADAPKIIESIEARLAAGKTTVAQLSPEDLTTYSGLLLAAGRFDEAEKSLTVLNTKKPGDPDTLYELALLSGARGDQAAQTSWVAALEAAHPGDPNAADLRARALLAAGKKAEAQKEWLTAAAADHPGALEGLANLALQAQKADEALKWADRAVKASPTDALAYDLRGQALTDLGRFPDAKADFDRALTLAPGDPWFLLDRGKLTLVHLFDLPSARADLEAVAAQQPENVMAWAALGETYDQLEAGPEAYRAWTKTLSLRPDYRWAYPSAAMLAFRYQDYPQAAVWAREAAKDHPGEYAFPFIEALSLKAQGQEAAGQQVLEKARGRFRQNATVSEMFRFLTTPKSDYYLEAALTAEKEENVRLRLRFYQGCFYALTKADNSAKAAFEEVAAGTLKNIPEIPAAKDWLAHGS